MTHAGKAAGRCLDVAGVTDTGRSRHHNEDALLMDSDLGLFAVADGLGGRRAGEVASAVALDRLAAVVRQCHGPGLLDPERAVILCAALHEADRAVWEEAIGRPERSGMASTAVVAWIVGSGLEVANVGDSRAYLLRSGMLSQISLDDSAIAELRRAGRLPDDPARWPPRQMITRALGAAAATEPHSAHRDLTPGDRVLLCSDGLTEMLADGEIEEVLGRRLDPAEACDVLVRVANERGGLDNITVVLIEMCGNGSECEG